MYYNQIHMYWLKVSLNGNCLIKQMYNLLKDDFDNSPTYNGNNCAFRMT